MMVRPASGVAAVKSSQGCLLLQRICRARARAHAHHRLASFSSIRVTRRRGAGLLAGRDEIDRNRHPRSVVRALYVQGPDRTAQRAKDLEHLLRVVEAEGELTADQVYQKCIRG